MNLSVQRRFTCFLLLALLSICRFDNRMATFAQTPNNEIKLPTGLTLELVTKGPHLLCPEVRRHPRLSKQ